MKTLEQIRSDLKHRKIKKVDLNICMGLINSFTPETLEKQIQVSYLRKEMLKKQAETTATKDGKFSLSIYKKELERLGYDRVSRAYKHLQYLFSE